MERRSQRIRSKDLCFGLRDIAIDAKSISENDCSVNSAVNEVRTPDLARMLIRAMYVEILRRVAILEKQKERLQGYIRT